MNRAQTDALNAAGEALKGLGLGRVKLAWLPADTLVPRDEYAVSLEAPDVPGLCIGVGITPAAALESALNQVAAKTAKAA